METDEDIAVRGVHRPDLRRSLFLPLAAILVLLFVSLGFAALWSEERVHAQRLDRDVDAAVRLFDLQLAGDIDTMRVATQYVLSDPAVLARFMARDREGLMKLVEARFDELHQQHAISHMYFVSPERVTFLRVHQPENNGDRIDRVTMLEAQRTGASASGLELGVLGIPTLRVVTPIWQDGQIVGYFEVGREVDQYAGDIRKTLGIDLHVLIRKDLVVEQDWMRGQLLLEHSPNWERFEEFVAAGPGDDGGDDLGVAMDEAVPLLARSIDEPVRVDFTDGSRLALGARPLLDESGREIGLLVVSLDVTTAMLAFRRTLLGFVVMFVVFAAAMVLLLYRIVHQAERSLRQAEAVESRAKAELEERVRERTAQLVEQIAEREETEAQLRQAQKMEVIGQLTGGVAHDFNNLLAIIISDLENLRDRLPADDLDELIGGACEATERGAALVGRLLAVSRKQPLSPRPVDVNQLVEQLLPLLERAVPQTIVIATEYGTELWNCFVDPPQLENLILNLVVNGRDAMPDGGTLTFHTRNRCVEREEASEWEIEPGDYVELTVIDTGTGMPSEVLARAFDPFFTTKDVGKGSGLGLSMVQGTAKQSGGHVDLESTLGVGTTVRVLLPRARPSNGGVETELFETDPLA